MKKKLLISAFAGIAAATFSTAAVAGDHLYEVVASKNVPGLSAMTTVGKFAQIDEALEAIAEEVDKNRGGCNVTGPMDGYGSEDILKFPAIQMMDGSMETVKTIEISCRKDFKLVEKSDISNAIGMPWAVAAHTLGDDINIVLGDPQTFSRINFYEVLGSKKAERTIMKVAGKAHKVITKATKAALENHGYTMVNQPVPGTEMTEDDISAVEAAMGVELNAENLAPSLTITGYTAEEVVDAIRDAVNAIPVADLNGDGMANDAGMLPGAFQAFMAGQMSIEEMAAMMAMGPMVWNNGGVFQDWKVPRVMDLSSINPSWGKFYLIELCQPFYAATALSMGIHHAPSMPCVISVWEENGAVKFNVMNPEYIFGYYFADTVAMLQSGAAAGDEFSTRMLALFGVFPTFVYNEIVAGVNQAMVDLGVNARLDLHATN